MAVKYLQFAISVHGLDAKDDVLVEYLKGFIKEAMIGALTGNMKEYSGFRNEFNDDVEVELLEQGGEFEILNEDSGL